MWMCMLVNKSVWQGYISIRQSIPDTLPVPIPTNDTRFEYSRSMCMLCQDRVLRSNAVAISTLPGDENKHDRIEHTFYLIAVSKGCTQCAI